MCSSVWNAYLIKVKTEQFGSDVKLFIEVNGVASFICLETMK